MKIFHALISLACLVSLVLLPAQAETELRILANAIPAPNGTSPMSLVKDGHKGFYGMTAYGGTYGKGTIFHVVPGQEPVTLLNLSGPTGFSEYFRGSGVLLLSPDGNFYGTTVNGGPDWEGQLKFGYGTVFKVDLAGKLTVLAYFTGTNGVNPTSLMEGKDGLLYGTTAGGGNRWTGEGTGNGTIFRVKKTGGLTTLFSFRGSNGSVPNSLLQLADGTFFGATSEGGSTYAADPERSLGTVFKFTLPNTLTTLVSFTETNGATPRRLIEGTDGNFYGLTAGGGMVKPTIAGEGTLFKITSTGQFSTLAAFPANHRGEPDHLVQGADGNFYGTAAGGSLEAFRIFKFTPTGVITTVASLAELPLELIVGDDGLLHGTVRTLDIFQVSAKGLVTTEWLFPLSQDGGPFNSSLVAGLDGDIYGSTHSNGTPNSSMIFKVDPEGKLTKLAFLPEVTGLLQGQDGNFYGNTLTQGNAAQSEFFRMSPDGTVTPLAAFEGNSSTFPNPSIEGPAGAFFGLTAAGGAANGGTFFKLTAAGLLSTLYSFNSIPPALPSGGLVRGRDGLLYGSTVPLDSQDHGSFFKATADGVITQVAPVYLANHALGRDGNFYGMTAEGFTVITPDGKVRLLAPWKPWLNSPLTMGNDGNFYATTQPYDPYSWGTLIQLTPAGGITTLYDFHNLGESFPLGGLTLGKDGRIYGSTSRGGTANGGLLYSFPPPPPATLSQTLTFPPIENATYGGWMYLQAKASSGLPVVYTVLSGPAQVDSNSIRYTGSGSVRVKAFQPGNASYLPSPEIIQIIAVKKAPQTIAPFPVFPPQPFQSGGTNQLIVAIPQNLENPPLFPLSETHPPISVSVKSGPAKIIDVNVISCAIRLEFTGPGVVTLVASQAGDANHYAAPSITTSFVVRKASQTITLPALTTAKANDTVTLPSNSSANLPIAYSVSGPATVSGNQLVFNGGGTVTLTATQPGDANYNAALQVVRNIRVSKLAQTILIIPFPTQTYSRQVSFPPPYEPTSSGLPSTFSLKSGPATTDGEMITVTGAGTLVLAYNQPGNEVYAAAPEAILTIKINKGERILYYNNDIPDQQITLPNIPPIWFDASVYPDNAPITYAISGPATLKDGLLTPTAAGLIRVTLSVPANANFLAAKGFVSFTITKHPQEFSVPLLGNRELGHPSVELQERAGESGLPIIYTVRGPATVSGNLLTLTGVGNVTLTASQPGDSRWAAAKSVSQTFKVTQAL